MAAKAKKDELTEAFTDAWRREGFYWDVTSHHYQNLEKKQESISIIIMEKCDMTGYKSSHRKCSVKKGVLKTFAKLTR